ncbi:hypothetical protein J2S00_004057 [Caldalkalibacillus uzonensis]|uniref:Uncharacterized protein n=2 Tax=Caldalkalibacillus uzonensis TaxID=353224 RepID=A0ABU0CYH2_9BACI|nr:hypothetical protein [Caldalkalibacillus uzonensis]
MNPGVVWVYERFVCLVTVELGIDFDGSRSMSPMLEAVAIELVVTGPSYRHAAHTLEAFVGYPVISHESIRQRLWSIEISRDSSQNQTSEAKEVLFIEVDGLHVKRQRGSRNGKEKR